MCETETHHSFGDDGVFLLDGLFAFVPLFVVEGEDVFGESAVERGAGERTCGVDEPRKRRVQFVKQKVLMRTEVKRRVGEEVLQRSQLAVVYELRLLGNAMCVGAGKRIEDRPAEASRGDLSEQSHGRHQVILGLKWETEHDESGGVEVGVFGGGEGALYG